MQTYDQFQAKWNNQPCEVVDPTNKDQCFDLVVQYCMDVVGLPITIFNGLSYAKQIWTPSTTLAVQKFDFIENTPTAIPQQGDIGVWSGYYQSWWGGGAGHTAVATGRGDLNTAEWFEQNDPTGTYSHLRWYNYNCILGWLRVKPTPVEPLTSREKIMLSQVNSKLPDDSGFRNNFRTVYHV